MTTKSRLYYLYGKDIYAVQTETAKLIKAFNSEEIRFQGGKDFDLSKVRENLRQISMFSEYTVIHINDLDADQLTEERIKTLFIILSDIPQSTKIIISATGFDIYDGKKVPTAKNKKIIDFVKNSGEAIEFNPKTEHELIKEIQSKYKIGNAAAKMLFERCLGDSLMIMGELEKLAAYSGDGEITVETVSALVSRRIDIKAFEITNSVTAFNGRQVFRLLDDLFNTQTDAFTIWNVIAFAFIDLYRAKTALNFGKSQQSVASDFGYKRDFVVRYAMTAARNIPDSKIKFCIIKIAETDKLLKSTQTDKRILIETALTEMLLY